MSKTLLAFAACLALAPALARGESLASAAETFVEQSLSLPDGSVRAHSVDPRLSLGECESGWQWSFPYDTRTTVQVTCSGTPSTPKRFVAINLPNLDGVQRQSIAARSVESAIVVAARDMPYGHVLGEQDLTVSVVGRHGRPLSATLSDPTALIGLTLTRPLRQGEPVGRPDARAHTLVKRSASVIAWSEFAGGRVNSKLIALQNGKAGDWIELENPQSGRKLRGRVQADGSVRLGSQRSVKTSAIASTKVPSLTVD
ncbi:MAG: flagellar basal body P-ring formation chaperone FlgA [Steroidobacteraceae bacterium]